MPTESAPGASAPEKKKSLEELKAELALTEVQLKKANDFIDEASQVLTGQPDSNVLSYYGPKARELGGKRDELMSQIAGLESTGPDAGSASQEHLDLPGEVNEINEDDSNALEVVRDDDGMFSVNIRMAIRQQDGTVQYDVRSERFAGRESATKAYSRATELGLGTSGSYYEPNQKNRDWDAFNTFVTSLEPQQEAA